MSAARFVTEKGNINWQEIAIFLRRNLSWMILGLILGAFSGVVLILAMPPQYQSGAILQVYSENESFESGLPYISEAIYESALEKEKSLLSGSIYVERVADLLMKNPSWETFIFDNPFSKQGALMRAFKFDTYQKPNKELLMGMFRGLVKFDFDLSTKTIKIVATTLDKKTSHALAQASTEALVELRSEELIHKLKERMEAIGVRLDELKASLSEDESNIARIKSRYGSGEESVALARLHQTAVSQRRSLGARLQGINASISEFTKEMASIQKYLLTAEDKALKEVKHQITDLRYELLMLKNKGLEGSERFSQTKAMVAKLEKWLGGQGGEAFNSPQERLKFLSTEVSRLQETKRDLIEQLKELGESYDEIQKNLKKAPSEEAKFLELQRRIELNTNLYSALKTREQDLYLKLRTFRGLIQVSQKPVLPTAPVRVSPYGTILFFSLGGVFIAIMILLPLAWFDDRVWSPGELRAVGIRAFGFR